MSGDEGGDITSRGRGRCRLLVAGVVLSVAGLPLAAIIDDAWRPLVPTALPLHGEQGTTTVLQLPTSLQEGKGSPTNDNTLLVLVVLHPDNPAAPLGSLTETFQVTQVMPPRLAILRVPQDQLAALRASPGVASVHVAPDRASLVDLSEGERLFADAWLQATQPKERPGDGLDWDAPGFLPPDPPPTAKLPHT